MFHHVLTTDFHLDFTRLMGSPLTKSPLLKSTFKIPPHTYTETNHVWIWEGGEGGALVEE